jgi:hypothetical protein
MHLQQCLHTHPTAKTMWVSSHLLHLIMSTAMWMHKYDKENPQLIPASHSTQEQHSN